MTKHVIATIIGRCNKHAEFFYKTWQIQEVIFCWKSGLTTENMTSSSVFSFLQCGRDRESTYSRCEYWRIPSRVVWAATRIASCFVKKRYDKEAFGISDKRQITFALLQTPHSVETFAIGRMTSDARFCRLRHGPHNIRHQPSFSFCCHLVQASSHSSCA